MTKHSVHEYEGVVGKLCGRHCAGVHHHLVRINPLTSRGNTRIRWRGRPHSETGRDQSGGSNGSQSGLTHLSSPVQIISRRETCQTMPSAAVMAITKRSILENGDSILPAGELATIFATQLDGTR